MNLYKHIFLIPSVIFLLYTTDQKAQVVNYIANGSFEEHYTCPPFGFYSTLAKHWLGIDSSCYIGTYRSKCDMSVPLNGNGYQYPKTGNAYIITGLFCPNPNCSRGYPKNRLKQTLKTGKIYCVKFHINITNASPRGMDGFGIYFGDGSIDAIPNCTIPLTYISPQVKNPLGNVISDTMNWVPITGTFVATGTEKYALIGNFLADNAVTTASINTPYYPQTWTDVNIDDVSCIEMDAPAYAGPDQSCVPGDSVFIGRQPDFAVDPGCVWYQLPNAIPIATISGLWVKPVVTTTYVVRQELECSALKWDTVVIYQNPLGLKSSGFLVSGFELYPVPADEMLNVKLEMLNDHNDESFEMLIYNSLGQVVREEEISFKEKSAKINMNEFSEGVYNLQLKSGGSQTASKRFVISR